MAGVEQHQIGVLDRLRRLVAVGGQRIGHALTVVDVHLATIGLDEDLPGLGRACPFARDRVCRVPCGEPLAPFRAEGQCARHHSFAPRLTPVTRSRIAASERAETCLRFAPTKLIGSPKRTSTSTGPLSRMRRRCGTNSSSPIQA